MLDRQQDGKKTIVSMFLYLFTNGIAMLVSLVTLPVLSNWMSTSEMGIATSFITLKNILNNILLLSMNISIDKIFVTMKEDNERYKFLSSIYIFSSLSAICFYVIYFVFKRFFNTILGFNTGMITILFVMCMLINACTLMGAYWNFNNKTKNIFIYNLLALPVSQIFSLILVYMLNSNKYLGRIIGVDFFSMIVGIGAGIIILKRGKFAFKKEYIKESLQISIPMIPHLLAQMFLTSCDLLMIKNMIGESEAGIYSVAYTVANILYTVAIQFFKPWSPWVYRRIENKETDSIKKYSNILIYLIWILCIGLFSISPELIKIFLNKNYSNAALLVAPIFTGIFFQILYVFFYDIEYFHKKNKQIAFFSVITAVINVLLNYICIKIWGYYAAAYTTLVSYLLLCIFHYYGMRRIDSRDYYDIKTIVILGTSLIIIAIINVRYNNYIIIRYFVLVLSLIYFVVINKKFIAGIWNKIKIKFGKKIH